MDIECHPSDHYLWFQPQRNDVRRGTSTCSRPSRSVTPFVHKREELTYALPLSISQMGLTRRQLIFLLAISPFAHSHFTNSSWMDTLPSYADPSGRNMLAVVVDRDDHVYVGGSNALHHFSPDLELKERIPLGPVMDHRDCMHPSYPCSAKRAITNNAIHAMQLIYNLGPRPYLLLCGTVYRMLCQMRPVDNLTEYHWVHPFNQSVGTSMADAYMYYGPGYDDQQHTLFTASSMEGAFKDYNHSPFLSSKVIEKDGDRFFFRYSFQNDTAKSAMEFITRNRRSVKDGFMAHGDFLYFLIDYKPSGLGGFTEGGILDHETRLVRVCTRDGTFRSYSELPIACDLPDGRLDLFAFAATLGQSPAGTKSLYVAFITVVDKQAATVLCAFPMADVVRAFTTFPRECLEGTGHTCRKEMKEDTTDFCGSDLSPKKISQPLVVSYFTLIRNSLTEAITTVKYDNETVAIVGDTYGDIRKISLTSGLMISKNRMTGGKYDDEPKARFRNPFVFDRSRQHIYLLRKYKILKFPVASCRVHATCEACFFEGRRDPLKCGWCGGYCAHLQECEDPNSFSRDTCTPSISQVFPQKGPIQGAVEIKITGDNFGSYSGFGRLYLVTVAGIPCKVLHWKDKEVTCMLGAAREETSGPVKLNVYNFSPLGYNIRGSTSGHLNFSYYVGPRIFGIRPNKGPTSGGTLVSLFGENLDFENIKDRYFIVRGRICNLRGFNSTTAWCITGNETKIDYPDKTAIVVGGTPYVMDEEPPPTLNYAGLSQSFEYIPDPEIRDVQPGFTTVSGLMNVTVTGLYLDSVQFPKMVVKVFLTQLSHLEFLEECWSDPESEGTSLTCSTPSFAGEPWLPSTATGTFTLLTRVSFIMDGVQWVREFSQHQELMSRLLYYPDPEFMPFRDIEKIADDQTSIEIKGKNFGHLQLFNNFHIELGEKEHCKITVVSTDLLTCELPPTLKNSSFIGTNISVKVFVGSTYRDLGNLTILPASQNPVVVERNLLVLYVLIPVAVIAFSFLCFRKIWKKKLLRKALHDVDFINRAEVTDEDYPPLPPRSFDGATEGDQMLDEESKLIFEELGLIIQKQHLIIGDLIGSGQFGKVFKGSLQIPNRTEITIAIKTLNQHLWRNPMKADLFMREALTMRDFDHPHVLGLLGVCFEGSVPHIVLPFMENGDLCNYIRDKTKVLLIPDLLKFAVDIASGMCYLSKLKFVHRDLAARNCLLDSSLRAKVADFGFARDIYKGNYYHSEDKNVQLPFRWTAPEVIETQVSTIQSDVWSYGVLLWELMTRGSIPYINIGNWDVLPYIKSGNRLNQPQFCPKPIYRSMLACWNTDPKKRPSFFKLHSYASEIQGKLLNDTTDSYSSALTYPVPAQNARCYDSKELYLEMNDQSLNILKIEDVGEFMKDLEEACANVNGDENVIAARTKC